MLHSFPTSCFALVSQWIFHSENSTFFLGLWGNGKPPTKDRQWIRNPNRYEISNLTGSELVAISTGTINGMSSVSIRFGQLASPTPPLPLRPICGSDLTAAPMDGLSPRSAPYLLPQLDNSPRDLFWDDSLSHYSSPAPISFEMTRSLITVSPSPDTGSRCSASSLLLPFYSFLIDPSWYYK